MQTMKTMKLHSISLFSIFFLLMFFFCLHGRSYAEDPKPDYKLGLSGGSGNGSGAGTITPDLFTGFWIMSMLPAFFAGGQLQREKGK